jgi:hypothetical protein
MSLIYDGTVVELSKMDKECKLRCRLAEMPMPFADWRAQWYLNVSADLRWHCNGDRVKMDKE